MIKHSILKQTSEGLVIDLYFSDRTDANKYRFDSKHLYERDLSNWLSHPDKTVKVDEGSKEKLREIVMDKLMKETFKEQGYFNTSDVDRFLNGIGIEISPDVFEVKCAGCDWNLFTKIDPPAIACCPDSNYFAFFKEEKEETQEDLWDDVYGIVVTRMRSADEIINELKQKFEIKRRKG